MINLGRHNVLTVAIDAVDYEYVVDRVVAAAKHGAPCSVTALAVHGVMTGFDDPEHARRINSLDLVVPDGQPVRWALRWLHGVDLEDRVYGPALTLRVLRRCAEEGVSVYFYGSSETTLHSLVARVTALLPDLRIAGAEPSRFRRLVPHEADEVSNRIRASGAGVVFVGLGCPRQEVWAYEFRSRLAIPILAVGAAFDFHAGMQRQAPSFMQDRGLEWLYRLWREPSRLWRRYLLLNPRYLWEVLRQRCGHVHTPETARGDERVLLHG